MILTDLRDYVQKQGRAGSKELAIHFDLSEDMVNNMIRHWITRNVIRQLNSSACGTCGHCSGCDVEAIYEWVDEPSVS